MARNQPLLKLLQDYRSAVRASQNPAHNAAVRDAQVHLLQRVQDWLWDEVDWAHLRVERMIELQAGQRIYDTPDDLPIERLEKIDVRYGGDWCPLGVGVDPAHYALHDSYTDERSWPVERWRVWEDEQIEIWPIPSENSARFDDPASREIEGQLRLTGIRKLRPFVADDDPADLDDRLIVLFAASETLAANGAPDAEMKAQAATRRLKALRANMSKKTSFSLFGAGRQQAPRYRAPMPTVHYRDRQS